VLREALRDGEDVAAARIVIDKALAGHAVTARFIVDWLTPRPRGRTIELDLPAGASTRDMVPAYDAALQAMASGEITPDEALMVTRILDGRLRALKAAAREERRIARSQTNLPLPLRALLSACRRARKGSGSFPARSPAFDLHFAGGGGAIGGAP
jgi:hypothetical protein